MTISSNLRNSIIICLSTISVCDDDDMHEGTHWHTPVHLSVSHPAN